MSAGAAQLAPGLDKPAGRVPMPAPGTAAIRQPCPFCAKSAVLIVALNVQEVTVTNGAAYAAAFGKVTEVKHLMISADFECAGPIR